MKDYPETSQFNFDFLASFSSLHANQETTWYWANYTTYLLLQDAASLEPLQNKLHPFMEKEMKGKGSTIRYYLERFDQIHLTSPHHAMVPNTSMTYLYILGIIAALILVIVCFTYINLSTAKSVDRAREVGVRKVSGAMKGQLFWQFMGESLILCLLSVVVSFGIAALVLPYFNILTERIFLVEELFTVQFILIAIGAMLVVSLLAGAYPAMILAGLQPIKVLKGVFKNTATAKWMQQSLIVFQFSITVFLIIATLVIQSQLNFIQNENLGYTREQVLSISLDSDMPYPHVVALKQQLKNNKDVTAVSRTMNAPVRIASGYSMRSLAMEKTEWLPVNANPIDEEYIAVNGLQLVAGNSFTEADMQDAAREEGGCYFILNESAARQLGWSPEEAIGQKMQVNREGIVRGVVKDFHFASMRQVIKPLVLFSDARGRQLVVKIDGKNISETISSMEAIWKQAVPNQPFEYHFLDEDYESLYKSETQLGMIMSRFSMIAITLACLGLFGLSSYVIQQRMKEISIRKVMGASLFMLLKVLSRNFVLLILGSIMIAVPLGYMLMRQWLDKFVYRIELSGWIFIAAGSTTLLIAMLTISIHAVRAALSNPVKNLRTE
jgi:putative ABC transport system permease protein